MIEADEALNLRRQDRCCLTCRYFRLVSTSAVCSECILLGRGLGIAGPDGRDQLAAWAIDRICDGWKRRPQSWNIEPGGNPHWADPYISRETAQRLRATAIRQGRGRPRTKYPYIRMDKICRPRQEAEG